MDFSVRVWKFTLGPGTGRSSPIRAWSFRRWRRGTPGTIPARPSMSRVRWSLSRRSWISCVSLRLILSTIYMMIQRWMFLFRLSSLHFVTNCQTITDSRTTNLTKCSTGNSIIILYFDFTAFSIKAYSLIIIIQGPILQRKIPIHQNKTSWLCNVAVKPTCLTEQKLIYGVSEKETAHISCTVDSNPKADSFFWTLNTTAGKALEIYLQTGPIPIK